MQPRAGFSGFDRANHIRVLNPSAEFRFSREPRDRRSVLTQLFAQHFECYDPMLGMIGTIDGRGSTLSDHVLYAVPGKRGTNERIARHAGEPNPADPRRQAKLRCRCVLSLVRTLLYLPPRRF